MSKPIDIINFRRRIKIALVKAFGEKCQYCGQKFSEVVFDFHHLKPKEKEFALGNSGSTRSKAAYAEEAKKCCMLCANCHRLVENKEIDNSLLYCNFNEDIYYSTIEKLISKQKPSHVEKMEKHSKKPDRKTLKMLIRQKSFCQIGRDFGVSDNAIRKWCISYGLPSLALTIKAIPQEEWDLI